ncbi:hypothetical protein EDB80DRAFT_711345 [Ilyonectria destructans]|nr:hypothetical protein EDB80DRAFT_711345 [Ilyonectria destructans]
MRTSSGRPRKACGICKSQKIRCSGDRPSCKRCTRLRHTCSYDGTLSTLPRGSLQREPANSSLTPAAGPEGGRVVSNATLQAERQILSAPGILLDYPQEDLYLGIPKQLVSTLAEAYFDNMYNAGFFLPRRLFLESLAAGTARHHVVLSVCAWGANFYRDITGQATFKENGSMIEWAKKAGRLVFQEAEDLHEENIVTFSNLALFWHSQGSWRISQLHKGNAYQLLYIIGLGSKVPSTESSLESEIRRRRFWACYLMHCYSSERLTLFEPIANMENLPLPWTEEDFQAGISRCPSVSLKSGQSNGGIFGELIKGLTFWSSVVSSIKSESSFNVKLTDIHALDERISDWWRNVRPALKLNPSNIAAVPHDALPKILLANLVYHQSLCALHASIVPLFCWGPGDDSWATARQLSAQLAFDHACRVSELIAGVFSTYPRLSAMPNFVAYAAYCGCAIQIPFMWCLNLKIRERAHANVKANVRMIHTMAHYWKFAALLQVYVRCLYNIHHRGPTILEGEPKHLDPSKLTNFKINAAHARTSILEFTGILRSKGDGYVIPGEETNDLGLEEGSDIALPPPPEQREPQQTSQEQLQQETLSLLPQLNFLTGESPTLDVFNSFLDPEMLNLFPNGEIPDLAGFDTNLLSLDYLEMEGWDDALEVNQS